LGKSASDNIEVGPSRPDENILGVDAISGATVTVIAQNQVIQLSGQAVGRQTGIIEPTVRDPAKFITTEKKYTWDDLVKLGAVQRLLVKPEQVGLPRSTEPFIELWFGDLNHPDIGISLIGKNNFERLQSDLKEGENAFFIIKTAGQESFKGSGFVRGGIFDRVQVKQGADAFTFRDLDYLNLYGLELKMHRAITKRVFLYSFPCFLCCLPLALAFLGNRIDRATGIAALQFLNPNTGFLKKCWRVAVQKFKNLMPPGCVSGKRKR